MCFTMVLERTLELVSSRQMPCRFLAREKPPFFGRSTRCAFAGSVVAAWLYASYLVHVSVPGVLGFACCQLVFHPCVLARRRADVLTSDAASGVSGMASGSSLVWLPVRHMPAMMSSIRALVVLSSAAPFQNPPGNSASPPDWPAPSFALPPRSSSRGQPSYPRLLGPLAHISDRCWIELANLREGLPEGLHYHLAVLLGCRKLLTATPRALNHVGLHDFHLFASV